MTKLELTEIIQNGENSWAEFKRDARNSRNFSEDFAKEVVAFSNGKGGKILVGVEDDGKITGTVSNGLEEWVMNICRTLVNPGVTPYFEEIKMDSGKKVAVVHVEMGFSKAYSLKRGERTVYYIRVGSTSREATREELARLFQASGAYHYDTAPVPSTSRESLDKSKLQQYFKKYRSIDLSKLPQDERRNLLINSDILKQTEYGEVGTVGGLLLFGSEPQKHLPQSGITFAYFLGMEVTAEYFEREEIEGTITKLIDETVKLIQKNIPRISHIQGLKRKEITIPVTVVREAVTNAVAHRDYTILGAKVRVYLFTDRIEVRSPGSLTNTVTIEKMKIGSISVARNPLLVNYLVEFKYIERLGRGILTIIQKMAKLKAPPPLLEEKGDEFVLTLYYPNFF
ncbi:MAG: ATP-binding protein [bacterium]